jgi:hypothetical protein
VYRIAATAHPIAQPLCTVPTAQPRYSVLTISPISTEPTAHSPPKPRPWSARNTKICSKFWAKPISARADGEPENRDLKDTNARESVGEDAGEPPTDRREQQRDRGKHAGLGFIDVKNRHQRRDEECEHHEIERVERQTAECGNERSTLGQRHLSIPVWHFGHGYWAVAIHVTSLLFMNERRMAPYIAG